MYGVWQLVRPDNNQTIRRKMRKYYSYTATPPPAWIIRYTIVAWNKKSG